MRVLLRWLVMACLACIVSVALRAEAKVVDDARLHFRLTVPDDFVEQPGRATGRTLYVFSREAKAPKTRGEVISIDRLEATIGPEPLTPEQIARLSALGGGVKTTTTLVAMAWKGFDVSVARIAVNASGREALAYAAQVPLKGEAIQINVVGDPASSLESEAIMRGVLASVEGQTNWLTNAERSRKLVQSRAQVAALIVVIVAFVFVVMRRTRRA